MRKYDIKRIMQTAHRIYKNWLPAPQSWSEALRLAWQWARDEENERLRREARIREMLKGYNPKPLPDYNDKSIPLSAYYNPDSKGHMGAHYVGD